MNIEHVHDVHPFLNLYISVCSGTMHRTNEFLLEYIE